MDVIVQLQCKHENLGTDVHVHGWLAQLLSVSRCNKCCVGGNLGVLIRVLKVNARVGSVGFIMLDGCVGNFPVCSMRLCLRIWVNAVFKDDVNPCEWRIGSYGAGSARYYYL